MARSLLFVHRTKADFAIFFQLGTSHSPNSGCPRAEPTRRVALATRAALEISVSPLDSIRRSRQTAFLSCSVVRQGAENEISVSKLDVFWADLHAVGATHSTDTSSELRTCSDRAKPTTRCKDRSATRLVRNSAAHGTSPPEGISFRTTLFRVPSSSCTISPRVP